MLQARALQFIAAHLARTWEAVGKEKGKKGFDTGTLVRVKLPASLVAVQAVPIEWQRQWIFVDGSDSAGGSTDNGSEAMNSCWTRK